MHRIFLCDDAPEYRRLLREVLNDEDDLDVVGEACDGAECVDEVAGAEPDVVLLDLNMPRMDGLETLPRLRILAPKAKVVVLTSGDAAYHESDAMEAGADAFIQKPMDVFELAGMIREKVPSLDRRHTPRAA
jgi:two-component system nitrate/nitrite response regulator NarL